MEVTWTPPGASWVLPKEAEFLKDTQIALEDHQTNIEGIHHGAEMAPGSVSIPINVPDRHTLQGNSLADGPEEDLRLRLIMGSR